MKSDSYHILCISSYNYSYNTVPEQLNGLSDGLAGVPCEITYEFMDAKHYYSSEAIASFYDYLKFKLDNSMYDYDLVVLADDTALHFGMNYSEELFGDTPILFMGVNNLTDAQTAAARPNTTGIAEVVDFKSDISLFSELFPERDNYVVVLDNSNSAQGEFVEFEKFADEENLSYYVINTSYYSQEGLKEVFSLIDDNSIIVCLDFISDGEGNLYTLESSTALLSEYAPDVPITRVTVSDAGNGVLGGVSYSFYDAGLRAGEMAGDILTKKQDVSDIKLVTDAVTLTYFDQTAMDKFNLTPKDLPKDAIIVDQHQTLALYYKNNKVMMNLIMIIILMLIAIIAVLVRSNRHRKKLILQDFMTKIPNRTFISQYLTEVIEKKQPFGLIMMDVDHFKSINDTLGHIPGDELLIEVASRLKKQPKEDVIFARIGGDEFMGFILDPSIEKAERVCSEVVEAMRKDFHLSCGKVNISVSMGAALFPAHTSDPNKLQGLADLALYSVKEAGRNGYRIYDSGLSQENE